MKALLLIAHGSRNPDSTFETLQLVGKIRESRPDYDRVEGCFLEIAEPDIASGLESLIQGGATEIDVLPYFLAQGNHVTRDIPGILNQLSGKHPKVKISTLDHIGAAEGMINLISEHLTNQSD